MNKSSPSWSGLTYMLLNVAEIGISVSLEITKELKTN